MVVSLWLWPTTKSMATKIHVKRWWFRWPCGYGGAIRGASPDGVHLWLHAKRLNAAIRQVPVPYCPGSSHGRQFPMKDKNTNKTHLLPSFLTVDPHKKAKQFWDTKWTLYSRHLCNKLHTNLKHHYSNWRPQLHFELSNVVNKQNFEKLLPLNESQKNLWAKYGHSV